MSTLFFRLFSKSYRATLLAIILPLPAMAATYYSSTSGNDANNGLSEATPWQTINKVNSVEFPDNSIILFKRGEVFRGGINALKFPKGLTFGAYGTGDNPVIAGSVSITGWQPTTRPALTSAVYEADVSTLPLTAKGIEQLYVNGELMTIARYPNVASPAAKNWLKVGASAGTTSFTDPALVAYGKPDNYWTGATLRIRNYSWTYVVSPITGYQAATGKITATGLDNQLPEWGYFLDGKLEELDFPGEWYYDATVKKVYLYPKAGVNLTTALVEGATYEVGLSIGSQQDNMTAENLTFHHFLDRGVSITGNNNPIVRNCRLEHNTTGIYVWNAANALVSNNILDHQLSSSLILQAQPTFNVQNSVAENNQITNTAMYPVYGVRYDGFYQGLGINVAGKGYTVRQNTVEKSSHAGIFVTNDGYHLVEQNTIRDALLLLNDGGALVLNSDGNTIRQNLIFDAVGNIDESNGCASMTQTPCAHHSSYGMGIGSNPGFKDNVIDGNTIANNPDIGIRLNAFVNTIVRNNVLYNNDPQIAIEDKFGVSQNNLVEGNFIYSLRPDQLGFALMDTSHSEQGTFDNNFYCNPYSQIMLSREKQPYALAHWQSKFAYEKNSRQCDIHLPEYTISNPGPNLILNSTFDTDVSNWSDSLSATISYDPSQALLDGGSLKMVYQGTSGNANVIPNSFSLVANQNYRLKFSVVGNGFGNILLRVSDTTPNNFQNLVERDFAYDTSRKDYEFIFQSPLSTTVGKAFFVTRNYDANTYWLDNVTLEPVTPTLNDAKQQVVLFSNTGATPLNITLTKIYFDSNGTAVTGILTLAPFSSKVLTTNDITPAAQNTASAYVFFNDYLITQPQPPSPTTGATTPIIIVGDKPLTSASCVDFGYVTPYSIVTKMFSVVSTKTGPASGGSYDALGSITFTGGTEFQQEGTAQNATALTNAVVVNAATGLVATAPVAPMGTFDIKFTAPATPQTITGRQINVYTSTDPKTNPLTFLATATVVSSITPQIQVLDSSLAVPPAGIEVANANTTAIDFTPTPTVSGNTITKMFSIKNVGALDLLLSPAIVTFTPDTGTGTSEFTVTAFMDEGTVDKSTTPPAALPLTVNPPASQGCPSTVATSDYSKFTITFSAPTVNKQTTYSGTITFTSNDQGQRGSQFSFPVKATVNPFPPSKAEIDIYDGTTLISNNTAIPIDFGTTTVGQPVQRAITVKNPSTVTLNVYDFSGNLPVGFSLLTSNYASKIPAGGATNLILQCDAATVDTFKGDMRIPSDDEDNTNYEFNGGGHENPYTFPLLCVVNVDTSGNLALKLTTPTNGLVTSDTGGINCGMGSSVCTSSYPPKTAVVLTAKADTGFTFDTWGGDCTGTTSPLTVTMEVAKDCSATFKSQVVVVTKYTLDFTTPQNGTVISDAGGINCGGGGSTCTAQYDQGSLVKLTATAATNATFTSWGGDCIGTTGPLTVTMDQSLNCTASFTANVSTKFKLTLTAPANGSITSDVGGLNCGTTCAIDYDQDAVVKLTAVPGTGMVFDSWSGACAGTTSPLSVTMDQVKDCSATFKRNLTQTTMSLTVTAPNNGTIKSNPGVINCGLQGTVCTDNSLIQGAQVTLTATPVTGGKFLNWTGDCSTSTTDSVTLTMGATKTCSATFEGGASNQSNLVVTVTGAGKVARIPAGATCGSGTACTSYPKADEMVLSARADTGSIFDTWGGDCAGQTGSLILLTMDKDQNCTATFKAEATTQNLTVILGGTGQGSVKSDVGGIDCGTVCTKDYPKGNPVNLIAIPDATSTFAGWSGDCASATTGNPAVVTLDADKSCTATFNPKSEETSCFNQGGLLTATGICSPAAVLESASTEGSTGSIFKGGVSKRVNSQYDSYKTTDMVYQLLDSVKTAGILKIDSADKGKRVEVLVAGLHVSNIYPEGLAWYMLVGCRVCPLGWNLRVESIPTRETLPALEKIQPLKMVTLDSDYLTVYMYEGQLYYVGPLDIFLGYRVVETGKIVFSMTPIHLEIKERPAQ